MKHSVLLAAFVTALAAAPVQAQPVAADLLPAHEVTTIIASMGMRVVGRPAWMRGRYVVAAVDRQGREVNVVVDAFDGQVLAVRPVGGRGFDGPPHSAPDGPPMRPPGVVPGAPPATGPGMPPPDDDEFFDNDRQQAALPPERNARLPRDLAATGTVQRSAPAPRKDAARDQGRKANPPVPRPRPALAKAGEPDGTPANKPAAAGSDSGKPKAEQPAKPPVAKPAQAAAEAAAKPEAGAKPAADQKDIRVIDLSKPKDAKKPEDKPGEAIRF